MRISANAPIQIKEAFSLQGIDETMAKVNKIARAVFLSLAALFVADTLIGFGGLIALCSLPFYLVPILCAVRFFQTKGYDNEKILAGYRKRALEESFRQTMRLHGLENIFKFDLLPEKQLILKLQDHLAPFKPESIAHHYLKLKKATEKAEDYRPIFLTAMKQAMEDLKASTLFENPHLQTILSSKLASEPFEKSALEYSKLKEAWTHNSAVLQDRFSESFLKKLDQFESHIMGAVSKKTAAGEWMSDIRKDITKLKQMKCAAEALPERYPLLQDCHGDWEDIQFVIKAHGELLKTFHKLRDTYRSALEQQSQEFASAVLAIDRRFS